ncbi:MAG: DUF3299 domain-containing protein [Bacteriovoracaceae bacterium]|jgi:hypothetical protein|nr:DUF3299 domain-containing protein [Bacteriovoracaceae bacterium]
MKILLSLIVSTLLSISFNLNAKEMSWEVLKTLEVDAKTKKNKMSKELEKAVGKEVTLKGFMMPLEYDAKEISEFLLMPYVPSCLHIPPPPANQLILVKMKKGTKVKPSFLPVELKGKLKIEENKELESSYLVEGFSMKEMKENSASGAQPVHP